MQKNSVLNLEENVTETYEMLQTAFGASCMNRTSVFERYKRFKEGKKSVRDNERFGKSKVLFTNPSARAGYDTRSIF